MLVWSAGFEMPLHVGVEIGAEYILSSLILHFFFFFGLWLCCSSALGH